MDFDTPKGRLAAAEALGPDGYNRAMDEHRQRQIVATVGGHAIRRVATPRFGIVWMVGDTGRGFPTREGAEGFAAQHPLGAD